MKKIVYSGIVKALAVLLFVVCIVCGVMSALDGLLDYSNEEEEIYSFERDFSQSWYVSSLLNEPQNAVFNTYYDVLYVEDETGYHIISGDMNSEEIRLDFTQRLETVFSDPERFENIRYYVQWNDFVFTNCGVANAEELRQGEYYFYLSKDSEGHIACDSSIEKQIANAPIPEEVDRLDQASTLRIACQIKEDVIKEYRAIWEKQEGIVINTFFKILICAIMALLLLVYLLCVCGKNADGEYKNMWMDRIFIELHLAAICGFGIGAVALCIAVVNEYTYGSFPQRLLCWVLGTASALGSLAVISSLLSIVRNIKTHRLMETSIILYVLRWIVRLLIRIVKWIGKPAKAFRVTIVRWVSTRTGMIGISMLFVYSVLVALLGIGAVISPIWLIIAVLLFGLASFVLAFRAKDLGEIQKGVREVRNGNISYKIPELKCEDMKVLAGNINDLTKGLDESVSAKVKAERLKTELITNVSHDLKTPITSIISYTELLSKVEDLPEEARDYTAVIAKKSDRLKRLTEDLFDISKVQSGNSDVVWEKLDVALLISQALGEHDNEIQSSELVFCVEAPKELYISADGRKMSRVLSNLINNILKYTMKNTRVFITASETEGNVEILFKNISAYPLLFNAEEITGRFVRGDESRTAEGNGLGLAIAKSYTEICNGSFEVVIDGDMFKAILKFKKYNSV